MSRSDLSRRDFLKLTGYGLMGMLLPDLSSTLPRQDEFDNLQGRITDRVLWSYDAPNAKAKRVKLYWRDIVLPILNTTIGEDDTAYNRVWYETEEGGYIGIQVGALTTKVVKGIHIRGFYAMSIIAGFINSVSTLPKKFTELEVINVPAGISSAIESGGNIIFWIVVGFFGFWVLSKFFTNIKTLREEG